jgi:hypothetical protein
MASIERLPSGRWRVRWREGGRGSPVRKSPSVDDKASAVVMLARIEAELAARHAPRTGIAESFQTLARAWAAAKVADGKDPTHTRDDLARLDALLARHGWTEAVDLTPADVDTARSATSTVDDPPRPCRWSGRAGALLSTVLRWSCDRRAASIDRRAIAALRPGPERRRVFPRDLVDEKTVAGWTRKAADISPTCAAIVHCLALYGWRPITAGRMRVGDVDLDRRVVRARVKGGDVIEHPIVDETTERLAAIIDKRQASEPLFIDPRTGRAFTDTGSYSVAAWWRWHIGARSYDAKRYAISRLLRHAPPHEVARITGHRCPQVLFRYATTAEERTRAILEQATEHGHTMGTRPTPRRSAARGRKSKTREKRR